MKRLDRLFETYENLEEKIVGLELEVYEELSDRVSVLEKRLEVLALTQRQILTAISENLHDLR
jgi:ACT domain-containing protein